VIDADLRRAALSRMFEEEQTAGLSDVLKGDLPPQEAVVALRDGGFHLLPAGSPGQHPGWLFREERIGQVLGRYRQMFDLVILDTPPVLPVADALSLGRWVDGAIMVIRYDVSRFPLVERARRRLFAAGIPILKTVVNAVKTSRFGSGYSYRYGYGDSSGYAYSYGARTATVDRPGSAPADNGSGAMATGAQEASPV
jgi:Mrp family chromosome partitioning ATPase